MKKLSPRVGVVIVIVAMLAVAGLLVAETVTSGGNLPGTSLARAVVILAGLVLTLVRLLVGDYRRRRPPVEMYEASYRDTIRTAFCEAGREKQKKQLLTGIAHYCRDEYVDAVKVLTDLLPACTKSDDYTATLIFLALSYSDRGFVENAIDVYYEALKYDDTRSTVWSNLGLLLQKQGKHEDSINCYLNAVKHDPHNAYAWNNLANGYLTTGDWDAVIEPALKALSIKGDMYQADNALAVAYYAMGDDENSQKYRRLSVLHGGDANVLDNVFRTLDQGMFPFAEDAEELALPEKANQIFRNMTAEPMTHVCVPFPESGNHSRVGGAPLEPADRIPRDKSGKPMGLLAAIFCSEVSGIPNFPKTGVLRFYVADDANYGLNRENPTDRTGFAVLYDEDETPFVGLPAETSDEALSDTFPVRGSYTIRFAPEMKHMLSSDYRYEAAMNAAVIKAGEAGGLAALTKTQRDRLKKSNRWGGHRIGGSPCFEETDPRADHPEWQGYDTLLLQLVTHEATRKGDRVHEIHMEFGHEGGCQFFISAEKLRAKDFSDVLYWWDEVK